MKIIPSKKQWSKWSLPNKVGYLSFLITLITLIPIIFWVLNFIISFFSPPKNIEFEPNLKIDTINCFQHQKIQCPLEISFLTFIKPHMQGELTRTIKWDKQDSDTRIILRNSTKSTIENLSLVIQLDINIRKVIQLTSIPDVSLEPFRSDVLGLGLVLIDEEGKEHTIPVDMTSNNDHFVPSYNFSCSKLLPKSLIELVVQGIYFPGIKGNNFPKALKPVFKIPKWIQLTGSYETNSGMSKRIYNVNFRHYFN